MRRAAGRLVLVALAGAALAGLWVARTPEADPAPPGVRAAQRPAFAAAPNLRVAVEELARQHGLRLVVAEAAAADLAAMPAPADGLDDAMPEARLRRWLNGFELVLHYGGDGLKAAWVFPRGQAAAVRATIGPRDAAPERPGAPQATAAAPVPAPAAAVPPAAGLRDGDEAVRLQALQLARQGEAAPGLQELRSLVDGDVSEAVRIEALEAFVAHPDASEDDVRALLEQAGQGRGGMLAEHARSLREARATPGVAVLVPEPVEPGS